jgi:hypothetical protein
MRGASIAVVIGFLFATPPLTAQDANGSWLERVSATQAQQPHWITPVATVTPRLEQEFRYDFFHQNLQSGFEQWNIGGGKGLELIPTSRTEVLINVPPYLDHSDPRAFDGFGDASFLVKYRLLSRNEQHGNAIVTAFLGTTLPTGSHRNGAAAATITPTIAAGKGWGHFDVQSTLGVTLPLDHADEIGRPVAWNTAFQYHVKRVFWPEVEVNSTFWNGGTQGGKKQTFITPGIVLGRFPIHHRVAFTFGAGVQIAATHYHPTNHNVIVSLRLPF